MLVWLVLDPPPLELLELEELLVLLEVELEEDVEVLLLEVELEEVELLEVEEVEEAVFGDRSSY